MLHHFHPEVGTNNIMSKAQRNKARRSFQPVKAQRRMRNLIFLISEAQRNFRNELFDSVEAQRNSAIAERHFRTKLKRNLTSAIEISQLNANTAFFAILGRKEYIICKRRPTFIEMEQNYVQCAELRYKPKKILKAQRN